MDSLQTRFSNIQLELLKLYSHGVSDQQLNEIKQLLAKYFAQKSIEEADKTWDKKGWTNDDMDNLLHQHFRTPYPKKH
jgi:hypothetical protein